MTRGKGNGRSRGKRGRPPSGASSSRNHLPEIPSTTPPRLDVPRLDDSIPDIEESNTESPFDQPNRDGESSHRQNSPEVRTRGDTQGSHASNNFLSRLTIEPYLDSFIPERTTRKVMSILRQYMPACGTWEQVPDDYKNMLFSKFKEHYTWLPHHEADIWNSWDHAHKRNYKQVIYRCKQNAIKQVGDDLTKIRDVPPKNMSQEDWQKICDGHMSAPHYAEKCAKAKDNRNTEKFGSMVKHTGGSISFVEHGRRMQEEQPTVKITPLIVHERTHRRQRGVGEYCDNKSKKVKEVYDESSQDGSNPTPEDSFDPVKWVDASGGPSKGRVYSYGNTVHYRDIVGTSSQSKSTTYPPPPTNLISEEQMKVIEEKLAKEREEAAIREATIMEEARKIAEEAKKLADEARERESVLTSTLAKCLDRLNTLEAARLGQTSDK